MSVKRKALVLFVFIVGLCAGFSTAWAQDENVAKAQRLLSALGYDPGKADGVMGPRTRRAIAAYQRTNNLPPTSELDEPTLGALGLLAAPQEPESPPAPVAPPDAWRTVLVYLRYYDTQPSQLVPYITEHFRRGVQASTWIRNTMRETASQNFSRLSWQIERVEPHDPEAASEATVEVYSRIRISGEEVSRREIFSLVRADEATWLINDLQSLAVSATDPANPAPDNTTAGR